MKVTKRYTDWLGVIKKAAEVVAFLQNQEASEEPSSLMLSNVTSMARTAGDGLLVLLRRGEKELAGDNVQPAVQGDLFPPTPADRAVVQEDLRQVVESWFRQEVEHDDTGRGPKGDADDCAPAAVRDRLVLLGGGPWPTVEAIVEWKPAERLEVESWARGRFYGEDFGPPAVLAAWLEANRPEPTLAAAVKELIFDAGDDGITEDDLDQAFADEEDQGAYEASLWALVHTGEVLVKRPEMIYTTAAPDLTLDVMAMIASQPDLGTEDGLPEGEIVAIPFEVEAEAAGEEEPAAKATGDDDAVSREAVPDLVDVVSVFVYDRRRVTRLEILAHFEELGEEDTAIVAAIDWLVEGGKLDEEGDHVARKGGAQDLDEIEGVELQALYTEVIGRKPGRMREDTLRDKIRQARAELPEAPPADEAPPAAEEPQPLES